MFDHAPSTPQLKPDTCATFDLYVTESAEIGVYNVKYVNKKTTFSSGVQEWESVKIDNLIQQWKTILREKRRVACLTLEPG